MKKFCLAVLIATFGLVSGAAHSSEGRGTMAEAEAMVKKAIAYIKKVGREKAFAEFRKPNGQFVDRDLYVIVTDVNGLNLAHLNPKMNGKNLADIRDADGKAFVRERIELAKKQNSGWTEYKFMNPQTKQVEQKSLYWERLDDMFISCGAYKP